MTEVKRILNENSRPLEYPYSVIKLLGIVPVQTIQKESKVVALLLQLKDNSNH